MHMAVVKKVRGGANPRSSSSRENSVLSPLSLPTKPNKPPTDLSAYIIFLYGDKGVGKSSLAAQFPNTLTIMAEPRRRSLPILQIPDPNKDEPPLTWDRVRRYRDLIVKDSSIEGVSFDTADRMYSLCLEYICNKANCKHPSDKNDYGKTWYLLKSEYEDLIITLLQAGKTVIGLSHSRKREITSITGDEFEQVCPTAPDACWTIWKAIADFAFYYGYVNQKRVIYLRGTELIWASCGTSEDRFLTPKGEPLLYIPVGDSPKGAYKSLVDAFGNKLNGKIYDPNAVLDDDDQPEEEVALPKIKRTHHHSK
jgi:hypothetical protein